MSDTSQSMAVGGLSLATTTGFMVAATLIVFILFLFVLALYLHGKRCYGADPVSGRGRAARRLVFVAESSAAAQQQCGLEAAAIEALPLVVFRRAAGFEDREAECAVCLCGLEEGEVARVLPRCGHVFHRECIDMWLYSHSTCPLCRNPVSTAAAAVPEKPRAAADSGLVVESSVSSHQERISSSAAGSSSRRQEEMVVEIDTDQSSGGFAGRGGGQSSAAVAIRSLRSMLSLGNSRTGGASPREGADIEQGRPAAPKTPTGSG